VERRFQHPRPINCTFGDQGAEIETIYAQHQELLLRGANRRESSGSRAAGAGPGAPCPSRDPMLRQLVTAVAFARISRIGHHEPHGHHPAGAAGARPPAAGCFFGTPPGSPVANQTRQIKPGKSNQANQTGDRDSWAVAQAAGSCPTGCAPPAGRPGWQTQLAEKTGKTAKVATKACSALLPTGFPRASIALPRG
jgi:hypothetical protein